MDKSQETLIKEYTQRHQALKSVRSTYDPLWTDIRDFLAPRTAKLNGVMNSRVTREDLQIINSAPRFAVRTLPAGMQSGVTSPMRPWFRLGFADPELKKFKPAKEWISIVEDILREIFARSNFYDRRKSHYGVLGNYGTSPFFIEEDAQDLIRCFNFPIGAFCISTDSAGRVDTLYRETSFSTRQMMQKFGDKVSSTVKEAFDKGNYETRHPVLHIIEPNRLYRPESALSQFKKTASIWLDVTKQDAAAVLRISGYGFNPALCPRWDVYGEDDYGVGCGEFAIGDAKQLQHMEKRKLQGIDKNVNPPMLADASLRNQRVSSLPGDTTYVNNMVNGRPGFIPAYQVNPYIKELREENAAVEERINEAFYKNLFTIVMDMADQPNITATQINALREEKLAMLGPVLERLNDEDLDPCISVVFSLAQARGMLPPPPDEIQGQQLKVEYVSILAQAQRAMGLGNIERFVGFVGTVASYDPSALDKMNTDAIIDQYADAASVPPQLVRSNEEVEQIRVQRQQQQAMQAAMEQAKNVTGAVKDMAGADMSGDNALTRSIEAASAN